jgi:glucose-6-phosphate dehydrogenase assembly protein OpcA
MDGLWSAEATTPTEVEDALRKLLQESQASDEPEATTRVLNLVAIVDREWRGEVENRLERVGRHHPSRTIICGVQPGRTALDAWATVADGVERVTMDIGHGHLTHLDTVVNPVLITDCATVVWSPHGHDEGVESLIGLADVVLIDSGEEPDVAAALERAAQLTRRTYVVDLAWLRSAPWRERIAATFDPPAWRPELARITAFTVRHREDSAVAALLLVGWLASRLAWEPQAVRVELAAITGLDAPGLAGVTLETASGFALSLDRGPGGLVATRSTPAGSESAWTVMGASRGESGILGEGVRQALLRDPTYGPALEAAAKFLSVRRVPPA